MRMTARGLNRATLARQLLLEREHLSVAEAVRRIVAVQAQHAASPYVALWNRLVDFDPTEVDSAFAERELVKATLLRITLHAVHSDDYAMIRTAMEPTLRAARFGGRFSDSGLTPAEADKLVPDLVDYADQPRVGTEYEAWLTERLGGTAAPPAWWGLRQYAPLLHAPTGGPWSFGPRPYFVAAHVRPVTTDQDAQAEALRTLIRRYLRSFGPASIADIAQFALVQRSRVKPVLPDDAEELEGPDGKPLYDVPGAPRPDEDTPAPPRLMAMWDSILLAYHDRGRVIPPQYRPHVIRRNGDVLPTLLVDGHVAGVWRPVDGTIEATAFRRLRAAEWRGLAAEAQSLLTLIAHRDPKIYRRYDRWWPEQPAAEVRALS